MVDAGMQSEGLRTAGNSRIKSGANRPIQGRTRLTARMSDVRTGQWRGGRLIRRQPACCAAADAFKAPSFSYQSFTTDNCRICQIEC
jgi:hypothetical protein